MDEKDKSDISALPIFNGISDDDTAAMMGCLSAVRRKVKKGQSAMPLSDEHYIGSIISGNVGIVSQDYRGNDSILAVLEKGEVFGETFICAKKQNHIYSFIAISDCDILYVNYYKVFHMCTLACTFHHRLVENMVSLIAIKNHKLMIRDEVISKRTLREKILTYFSILSSEHQSDSFNLPLNRTDTARYLAADRSALSRELSHLCDEKIITLDKSKVTVNRVKLLDEL